MFVASGCFRRKQDDDGVEMRHVHVDGLPVITEGENFSIPEGGVVRGYMQSGGRTIRLFKRFAAL